MIADDATKLTRREVAESFADKALEDGWAVRSRIADLFEECAENARAEEREACAQIAALQNLEGYSYDD